MKKRVILAGLLLSAAMLSVGTANAAHVDTTKANDATSLPQEESTSQTSTSATTTETSQDKNYSVTDDQFYVTFKGDNVPVYKDENQETAKETMDLHGKTFQVKKVYDAQGTQYYSLFDNKNEWVGCVKADDATRVKNSWGLKWNKEAYVSIVKDNYNMYDNQSWNSPYNTKAFKDKTVKMTGYYNHFNGSTYYSLSNGQDQWLGYVNGDAIKEVGSAWGDKFNRTNYLTIKNPNYSMYDSRNWHSPYKTDKFNQQTLKATGYYNHFNGSTYYSLQDKDGQWLGYVNGDAAGIADDEWGSRFTKEEYVTVMKGNYNFYTARDFNKKKSAKDYEKQTLKAIGYYKHYNGSTYYSLQDKDGKWVGYINKDATKAAPDNWGAKINETKYITIGQNGYKIYRNRSWKSNETAQAYANETLKATGYYHHYNGSTYYSLENNKGDWIGYINANAGQVADDAWGAPLSAGEVATVTDSNYDIYSTKQWDKKAKVSEYKGKSLAVKQKYHHFNGNYYAAIYASNGDFIGYVNNKALRDVIAPNGVYQYLMDIANDVVKKFGGYTTSGYRPGSVNELGQPDDHSRRLAIDIGVNPSDPNVNKIYDKMRKYIVANYKDKLKYVIALNTWAAPGWDWLWVDYPYGYHMDHIHISGLDPSQFS